MTRAQKIRAEIESLMIAHPTYVAARTRIESLLEDHRAGLGPSIEVLVGPSRSGKTALLKEIQDIAPPYREGGRLIVPILYVPIPAGTSPKDLPISVIQSLGVPAPRERMRASELFGFMSAQLKLARVELTLFDEASHLVDVGSRTPPRLGSDWFKDYYERILCPFVLSGVYRLEKLIASNEQLRNRTRQPIDLMPYRWDFLEDRRSFAGCARAFMSVFESEGCAFSFDTTADSLYRDFYAASAGHIGLLANVFSELAKHLGENTQITVTELERTVQRLHLPGNGVIRPFSGMSLKDEHLLQVLASEMSAYDVALKGGNAATAVGQAMANAWRHVA